MFYLFFFNIVPPYNEKENIIGFNTHIKLAFCGGQLLTQISWTTKKEKITFHGISLQPAKIKIILDVV